MITEELAEFIISLKFEDILVSAIEKAKTCFLDFLGVSLRGSMVNSSQIALRTINTLNVSDSIDDSKQCIIIGDGKGNVLDAAFVNGISSHALDLDDGHRLAQLHPGCTVIPAALALCEHLNKDGKEFLEALIVGYEVAVVLGKLINPEHRNQGFHSTGTVGAFAATAASCKLLGLNREETINALGLAGTQAAGLLESDHAGTMGKHLHAGKAAQSGILSAFLAQNGFTGASSILEGKEGFLKAMCGDYTGNNRLNRYSDDLEEVVKSDMGRFHINDVYLKKYPVCRHLHSTIDSARAIISDVGLKNIQIHKIEKITVKTYKTASEHDNYNPETPEAVRQSLPISLAITLINGDLNLDNIGSNFNITPEIREMADKIVLEMDPDLDDLQPLKRPSKLIIEFKEVSDDISKKSVSGKSNLNFSVSNNSPNNNNNNNVIEKTTFLPQGEPENPFKKEDIMQKFQFLNPDFDDNQLKTLNDMIFNQMEFIKIREIMDKFNS